MYLGQGSAEMSKDKPWYLKSEEPSNPIKKAKEERKLAENDPLTKMNQFLEKKKVVETKNKQIDSRKKSVEEMRKERTEREKIERERVAKLFKPELPSNQSRKKI